MLCSSASFLSLPSQYVLLPVYVSVLNGSSQEEVCVHDVRILPNFNASYLPMMPDGSVLLVDNVWYDLINLCVLNDFYFLVAS